MSAWALVTYHPPSHTQGDRLRMDGTLMGVEKGGKSVLPEWKRGHFRWATEQQKQKQKQRQKQKQKQRQK
jgi:hypothetical protein